MRKDDGLPFLLKYENVAWYEDGIVRILDRRVYPRKIEFRECRTHGEVAEAIAAMVTQSAGPYSACAMGMALASHECAELKERAQREFMKKAAEHLQSARPTTAARMRGIANACLKAAENAWESGKNLEEAMFAEAVALNELRYGENELVGQHLNSVLPADGNVMTHCFAETALAMALKFAKADGKTLRMFCPETRPYFQGGRLTATMCADFGFPTAVITDNMPAWIMKREHIDVFTCASDAVCMTGHVTNKVGTLQIAIAAKYFGIPVYVTGIPEKSHPDEKSVKVEYRDGNEVLSAAGVRIGADGVKGIYPAFDITPPELITGIVTNRGIFKPALVSDYYETPGTHGEEKLGFLC